MKKAIRIILVIITMISLTAPSLAINIELRDLGDTKYKIEIEKLVEDGTISGYLDGTFKPKSGITRGELSKILAITLNLKENKNAAEHFMDVKGKWNQGFVGALYEEGIMIGVAQDNFGQDNNVTREELAVILLRIFGLEELAYELALDTEFADEGEIANWAKHAVAFAYKIDLMGGVENDDSTLSFLPKFIGERELVAKLVYELKYNRDLYEKNILMIKDSTDIEESKDGSNNEQNESEETSEEKSTEDKPSYDSIIAKYSSKLSSLEASASSQLSALYDQAIREYNENKNKPGFSPSELYNKYLGLAYALESQIDSQVSSILSSLESELSSHGYDTSIVSSFQAQYEAAKDAVREGF